MLLLEVLLIIFSESSNSKLLHIVFFTDTCTSNWKTIAGTVFSGLDHFTGQLYLHFQKDKIKDEVSIPRHYSCLVNDSLLLLKVGTVK